eukprot:TRINITY_DN2198_c0_g1_i3.p1 TRINITY_DN2198_c0_g1~~TRINITY_DN2198_c0_g1_i3.p1  ORF type:complete len:2302 (+),score=332.17 TRINITY_DN2198_c0_g1_i3:87-6992(+)
MMSQQPLLIFLVAFITVAILPECGCKSSIGSKWSSSNNTLLSYNTGRIFEWNSTVYWLPDRTSAFLPGHLQFFDYMHILSGENFLSSSVVELGGDIPRLRDKYCIAKSADEVFLFGGCCGVDSPPDASIYSLNLRNMSWHKFIPTSTVNPTSPWDHMCFVRERKFYAYVSVKDFFRSSNILWEFNPETRGWSQVRFENAAPLTANPTAVFSRDTIFHYGGCGRISCTNEFWLFHFANRTWEKSALTSQLVSPIPASSSGSVIVVDHIMYLYCGFLLGGFAAIPDYAVSVIDLGKKEIIKYVQYPDTFLVPYNFSLPAPRMYANLLLRNNSLYMPGSTSPPGCSDSTYWKFDLNTSKWTFLTKDTHPYDFYQSKSCRIDNKLYFFGGTICQSRTFDTNHLWSYDTETDTWELLSPYSTSYLQDGGRYPYPLIWHTMVPRNQSIFIIGGRYSFNTSTPIAYVYNTISRNWSMIDVGPQPAYSPFRRGNAHSALFQDTLVLWSGIISREASVEACNLIYTVDLTTMKWNSTNPSGKRPPLRTDASVFVKEESMCIYGGFVSDRHSSDVWCYSLANNSWTEIIPRYSNCWPLANSMAIYNRYLFLYLGSRPGFGNTDLMLFNFDDLTCSAITTSVREVPSQSPSISFHDDGKWYLGFSSNYEFGPAVTYRTLYSTSLSFCDEFVEVDVASDQTIEDGSKGFDIIPDSRCTWRVKGANVLEIVELSVSTQSTLVASSINDCEQSPMLKSLPTQYNLLNHTIGDVLYLSEVGFDIKLIASNDQQPQKGFKFNLYRCPFGHLWNQTCFCPSGSYISYKGDCLKCPSGSTSSENSKSCLNTAQFMDVSALGSQEMQQTFSKPRYLGSAVVVESTIYHFGGSSSVLNGTASLHSLESITTYSTSDLSPGRSIASKGAIPSPRVGFCSVKFGSDIYIFGGRNLTASDSRLYSLNTQSHSWSLVSTATFAVHGQACVEYESRLYIHGGITDGQNQVSNNLHSYEFSRQKWTTSPASGSPRLAYASQSVYRNVWYFLSGFNGIAEATGAWTYDFVAQSWSSLSVGIDCSILPNTLPLDLSHQKAAFSSNGKHLFVYGGHQKGFVLQRSMVVDMEKSVLVNWQENESKLNDDLQDPPPKLGASAVSFHEYIIVLSGASSVDGCILDDVWRWDSNAWTWSAYNYENVPVPRTGVSMFMINDSTIGVYGGYTCRPGNIYFDDIWTMDSTTFAWKRNHPLLSADFSMARAHAITVFYENELYILGGKSSSMIDYETMAVYNITSGQLRSMKITGSVRFSKPYSTENVFFDHDSNILWMFFGEISAPSEINQLISLNVTSGIASEIRTTFAIETSFDYVSVFARSPSACIYQGFPSRITNPAQVNCYQTDISKWVGMDFVNNGPAIYLPRTVMVHDGILFAGQQKSRSAESSEFWFLDIENRAWATLNGMSLPCSFDSGSVLSRTGVIYVFACQNGAELGNAITTFYPSFCSNGQFIHIQGHGYMQDFGDGSKEASYFRGAECFFAVSNSTYGFLSMDLYEGDSLQIITLQPSGATKSVVLYGSVTDYAFESLGGGFTVVLQSISSSTGPFRNTGFVIKHIACPSEALFEHGTCKCPAGKKFDVESSLCRPCSSLESEGECALTSEQDKAPIFQWIAIGVGLGVTLIVFYGILRWYRIRQSIVTHLKYARTSASVSMKDIELHELLGIGTIAECYLGEWRGTLVVVKKLLQQRLEKMAAEKLSESLSTLSQLRHPNILLYMGTCAEHANIAILVEYLKNGSLHDYLGAHPLLAMSIKIRLMGDIFKGLSFLHASNPPVIHGNLKSKNIMLDEYLNAKIGDFLLYDVANTQDQNRSGFEWLAPEQIQRGVSSTKADIYSLGIVIWEILTQRRPYDEYENKFAVMIQTIQGRARPTIPSDTTAAFRVVMEKCWAHDESLRPSMDEIMRMLSGYLTDSSIAVLKSAEDISSDDGQSIYNGAVVCVRIAHAQKYCEENADIMSEGLLLYGNLLRKYMGKVCSHESDEYVIEFSHMTNAIEFSLSMQELMNLVDWPELLLELIDNEKSGLFRGLLPKIGIVDSSIRAADFHNTVEFSCTVEGLYKSFLLSLSAPGGVILLSQALYEHVITNLSTLGDPFVQKFTRPFAIEEKRIQTAYEVYPRSLADRVHAFSVDDDNSSSTLIRNILAANMTDSDQTPAKYSPLKDSGSPGYSPARSNSPHEGPNKQRRAEFVSIMRQFKSRSKWWSGSSDGHIAEKYFRIRDVVSILKCEIDVKELILSDVKIGTGQFGTVYRGIYKVSWIILKAKECQHRFLATHLRLYS